MHNATLFVNQLYFVCFMIKDYTEVGSFLYEFKGFNFFLKQKSILTILSPWYNIDKLQPRHAYYVWFQYIDIGIGNIGFSFGYLDKYSPWKGNSISSQNLDANR